MCLWGLQSFMSQHIKDSAKGTGIEKKWFIRRRHLWGLQVGGWEDAAQALSGLQFYNQRKSVEGEKTTSSSFLSRCQGSIISSSTSGGGIFLSLHVQLGVAWCIENEQRGGNIYWNMINHLSFQYNVTFSLYFWFECGQRSRSWESLTYWAHRTGCGYHVTIVLLFWGTFPAYVA